MDSVQTLHDFALNLLNDPTALAAFGTDPQGVLAAAGLGDVSAADVHEVIPLVLDFVPVDSLPAVGGLAGVGSLPGLGTDAPGIQGAIDQLTALTAGLGLPAVPALPGVGDLGAGALPGVGDLGLPAVPGVGALPGVNDLTTTAAGVTALAGDFGNAGDLGSSLDAVQVTGNLVYSVTDADHSSVVATVEQAAHLGDAVTNNVSYNAVTPVYEATSQVGDISGDLSHTVNSVVGQVGDFSGILKGAGDIDVKHVTGEVTNAVHGVGDVSGVVSNATGISIDHNVAGAVGDIASGNTSAVHDVVSDVSDVSHNALGNLHLGDIASNDIHLGH